VPQAGSVDLEVRYVASGASWSSSYDVRIATTQQHAVTCIYYGEVRQVHNILNASATIDHAIVMLTA
jgi:hypothetical protein